MRNQSLHQKDFLSLVLVLIPLVFLGAPASAQSVSGQSNIRIQDNDTTRIELGRFDQFLDSHREIGEQLRKDPSLVNNREFVEKHPALQTYLQEHPGVREEIKENPNAFMRQENRFDRGEDRRQEARFDHQEFRREDERRDETPNGHVASFREFLGGHSDIARQVSKDPSVVKNEDYLKNHPELQGYLDAHPGVRGELMENPQKFVKSTQQFSNSSGSVGTTKTPAPTVDLKPKQ
jgi:hypothetical protein